MYITEIIVSLPELDESSPHSTYCICVLFPLPSHSKEFIPNVRNFLYA